MNNDVRPCEECGIPVNCGLGFCTKTYPLCSECIEEEIEFAEDGLYEFLDEYMDAESRNQDHYETDEEDVETKEFYLYELYNRMTNAQKIEANNWRPTIRLDGDWMGDCSCGIVHGKNIGDVCDD